MDEIPRHTVPRVKSFIRARRKCAQARVVHTQPQTQHRCGKHHTDSLSLPRPHAVHIPQLLCANAQKEKAEIIRGRPLFLLVEPNGPAYAAIDLDTPRRFLTVLSGCLKAHSRTTPCQLSQDARKGCDTGVRQRQQIHKQAKVRFGCYARFVRCIRQGAQRDHSACSRTKTQRRCGSQDPTYTYTLASCVSCKAYYGSTAQACFCCFCA